MRIPKISLAVTMICSMACLSACQTAGEVSALDAERSAQRQQVINNWNARPISGSDEIAHTGDWHLTRKEVGMPAHVEPDPRTLASCERMREIMEDAMGQDNAEFGCEKY